MMKLNNKGITTIEVLLCFILVVVMSVSMYGTISSFNQKRMIEQAKEKVYSYEELVTKEIQDALIKEGLTHVKYSQTKLDNNSGGAPKNTVVYTVEFELRNGSKKVLKVYQGLIEAESRINTNVISGDHDYFMIEFGDEGSLIEYPLPDLGESDAYPDDSTKNGKISNLTINNVLIKIEDDKMLSIHIGFYHPDLGTKHAIDIVCPIDYISDGNGTTMNLFK